MRALPISLAAALLLAGCQSTATPPTATAPASGAPAYGWGSHGTAAGAAATREQRLARWEREWEEAKQTVATTRAQAVASGEPVPPELDREVTELLNRTVVADQGDETRIEDLQDAVSDALRLAEILSIG